MMILLINKVKAQSIQFEINMHLSAWVRVLLAVGYHLQYEWYHGVYYLWNTEQKRQTHKTNAR